MRVPLSWLRDYVAIDMPVEELASRLDVSTAVVAAIEHRGVPDEGANLGLFRVGKVLEAAKHPNADRLQLCAVDVGEPEPYQIVCGAWNFGAGATVAVALPGAELPGGLVLERRTLRGKESAGMILSERELELGQDHSGIIVLDSGEPGTPLADVLPIRDVVIDLEITGNRPDLLSIYGIAREVATLYRLELAPAPGIEPELLDNEIVKVTVDDWEGCPRYIGRLFRDVQIAPSPTWLRARLDAAGMRPISNVVDVTNYVMLGLGNPLHAFDFATLAGGEIIVRRARSDEKTLRTLDGVDRLLEPADLLIADADRAVAFAGIMGGEETEISASTTDVLLEAANFEPTGLWRTSERLRLRTEGSNRWEKGVDPYLAEQAAVLATQLVVELTGGRWVGHTDARQDLPERPVVRFRSERANAFIGLAVEEGEQHDILARLGNERRDGEYVVPTWRARDLVREVDLIEEVARFKLQEVPFTLPVRREMHGRLTRLQRLRRRIEDTLVALGYSEVYTPSLVASDAVAEALRLPEPISVELAIMRTELLPSLVDAARRNAELGHEHIALFEVARVYLPAESGGLPDERVRVAGIAQGGYLRGKGVVDALLRSLHATATWTRAQHPSIHPGKAAHIEAGLVGELHPALLDGVWSAFELDLEVLVRAAQDPVTYEDVLTYPAVFQDIAVAADEDVAVGALVDAAHEAAGDLLREARVFDVYRGDQVGPGRKSVAIHLAFQSPERTLTEEEATEARERIVAALAERFGAELRA